MKQFFPVNNYVGAALLTCDSSDMEISGAISEILRHKSSNVWTIAPEATVFEAIKLMSEKNVGALLVMDAQRLVGIISERDYTRNVILKGRLSRDTFVRDIMSENLVVTKPEELVVKCLRLMTEHHVRHLPVMDGDQLVGVISTGDLVNWIISAQTAAIDQLQKYITGEYPA